LGEGAFGVVYRALDLSSSSWSPTYRAVKIIRKSVPDVPMMHELLQRETKLHRLVADIPNVLTLYGVFQSNNYMYLVLDYCPGGNLSDHIIEGTFEKNDALVRKVFVQILDAVHECHERGVYHRDLKPENILCRKDGSGVYLADFGLATDAPRSEEFGCGSSYWMSPECIGYGYGYVPYSTRQSDMWSLGIILVNIIASCYPWHKAEVEDISFSEFLDDPCSFYDRLPISRGAREILERVFRMHPVARITIPKLREAILNVDSF
ncbi:kinase-like protein, partial [Obba rivulosa]